MDMSLRQATCTSTETHREAPARYGSGLFLRYSGCGFLAASRRCSTGGLFCAYPMRGTVGANELANSAVTNAKIAADSVSLAKLGSDVGTVAVQSTQPSDTNVKLWIQI